MSAKAISQGGVLGASRAYSAPASTPLRAADFDLLSARSEAPPELDGLDDPDHRDMLAEIAFATRFLQMTKNYPYLAGTDMLVQDAVVIAVHGTPAQQQTARQVRHTLEEVIALPGGPDLEAFCEIYTRIVVDDAFTTLGRRPIRKVDTGAGARLPRELIHRILQELDLIEEWIPGEDAACFRALRLVNQDVQKQLDKAFPALLQKHANTIVSNVINRVDKRCTIIEQQQSMAMTLQKSWLLHDIGKLSVRLHRQGAIRPLNYTLLSCDTLTDLSLDANENFDSRDGWAMCCPLLQRLSISFRWSTPTSKPEHVDFRLWLHLRDLSVVGIGKAMTHNTYHHSQPWPLTLDRLKLDNLGLKNTADLAPLLRVGLRELRLPSNKIKANALQDLDLASNKTLSILDLSRNRLQGNVLQALGIGENTGLRRLSLAGNGHGSGITGGGLGGNVSLRELDFSCDSLNLTTGSCGSSPAISILRLHMSNASFDYLPSEGDQMLRVLDLSGAKVSRQLPGIAGILQRAAALEELYLDECDIRDKHLARIDLTRCERLRILSVTENRKVTDVGLRALRLDRLPALRQLDLSKTAATATLTEELERATTLRRVIEDDDDVVEDVFLLRSTLLSAEQQEDGIGYDRWNWLESPIAED